MTAMGAERVANTRSIVELLDHVIDKGIVVDAWARLSTAGIDLLTARERIVVASEATSSTYTAQPNEETHPGPRNIKG